ncbi:MAG: molybdate transport system permease protein, partial [Candidatus Paceibacteria bacterium]
STAGSSIAPRKSFASFLIAGTLVPVLTILALLLALFSYSGPITPLQALADGEVMSAVGLSLFCATVAALLGMAVAIPTAYTLARVPFPGRRFVDTLLDIPVVLSPVAIGMMLLLAFRTSPGSWIQENLLRFVFELPGIILAQFIVVSALQIRVLKSTFEEIPARTELVARLLGCGPWNAFWRVTLPLARPGLISALILGWGRAMGEYGATVTIAGAMRGKTETIPVGIALNWSAVRVDATIGLILVLVATTFLVLLALRTMGREHR